MLNKYLPGGSIGMVAMATLIRQRPTEEREALLHGDLLPERIQGLLLFLFTSGWRADSY